MSSKLEVSSNPVILQIDPINEGKDYLSDIPVELLKLIFEQLSWQDFKSVREVCKTFSYIQLDKTIANVNLIRPFISTITHCAEGRLTGYLMALTFDKSSNLISMQGHDEKEVFFINEQKQQELETTKRIDTYHLDLIVRAANWSKVSNEAAVKVNGDDHKYPEDVKKAAKMICLLMNCLAVNARKEAKRMEIISTWNQPWFELVKDPEQYPLDSLMRLNQKVKVEPSLINGPKPESMISVIRYLFSQNFK